MGSLFVELLIELVFRKELKVIDSTAEDGLDINSGDNQLISLRSF